MKFKLRGILYILIFSIVASCSGSKTMYKKGQKLEEAGMHYEASTFYINALQRNQKNEKAIIALKSTGQKVLDDFFTKFYQLYANGQNKEAVYAYLEAVEFQKQVENLNVRLTSAAYYDDYYEEVKDKYIKELYFAAQNDLENENFADAEKYLHEIQQLDPSYKDVEKLKRFAYVEPRYRKALEAYDGGENRKAYYLFDEIINHAGAYKESKELRAICLENAQYTVGFLSFENKSRVKGIENSISGAIIRDIMNFNDPFLKVIDRTMTDKIISEQKLGMTGIIDQNTAARAGELLGAKAILTGTITSAVKQEGRKVKQSRKGYLGKPVTKVNQETGEKYTDMVYSKVYYYEHSQVNKASCTFQYQLISTETGEVLLSDVITKSVQDEINYAAFSGDSKYLYKGTWAHQSKRNSNDKIYNSYSSKRELDRSLKGKKTIRSSEQLSNQVYGEIANAVSLKIKQFNPEG